MTDQSIGGGRAKGTAIAKQATEQDTLHLRRSLELAERGRGAVSPNPMVGAVIGRGATVLGEGFHAAVGDLHAERAALEDCRKRGEDPAGATMYVTLEPCAHHGRQPPCTDAILEAGIARLVYASEDPTEKASGRGPGILRDGGVTVEAAAGEEAAAARLLNQAFRKHARTGRPLVILKMAMSLDGRVTTGSNASRWISGGESRELVHRWRAENDAIAVGIGTVLADDPLLTARSPGSDRQPQRVIFDSGARLPLDSQLIRTVAVAPLVVVAGQDADRNRVEQLREAGAVVLLTAGETRAERVTAGLTQLGRREVTSLLLEGGPILAHAFLAAGEVDEARIFVAPMLIGRGRPAIEGDGPPLMSDAWRALGAESRRVGDDVVIQARFREW